MGPKRKAQEEDVEPQEGKKSKVSTSPADEETTSKKDQLLARFIKAGKEREEAEGIPDRTNELHHDTFARHREEGKLWVEILARHLACEPRFIEWMGNPGPMEDLAIESSWLASVYLPGRYARYWGENGYATWYQAWFQGKTKRRIPMVTRAKELCLSVASFSQTKLENTVVDLPDNSPESQKRRYNLFQVQATRQRLLATIKRCTDVQHGLAGTIGQFFAGQPGIAAALEELSLLEQTKARCREKLKASALNEAGVEILDKLLELVPQEEKTGVLYQTPSTDEGSAEKIFGPTAGIENAQIIAQKIQASQNFQIDYLDGRKLGDGTDRVFFHKTTVNPAFVGSRSANAPKLRQEEIDWELVSAFDKQSADWLRDLSKNFDHARFTFNFRVLESSYERPHICETATKIANIWEASQHRAAVFRDNVVHVRRLVQNLVDTDLIVKIEGVDSLAQLQIVLRRMLALLAVVFGCCSEPALLCTIMDHLLEQLAELIIGHKDPKLETLRMRRVSRILSSMTQQGVQELPSNSNALIEKMEREHHVRQLLAEIARFYRGAVVIGVAAVSPSKSNQIEDEMAVWYESLVQLSSKCGHRSCLDQLEVRRIWGAERNRWGISVAVRDSRLGFPEERSDISTNRKMAYPCLSILIHYTRYHDALGPFFHYFAHLYHPACRPFRGKSGLIEDITVMEERDVQ